MGSGLLMSSQQPHDLVSLAPISNIMTLKLRQLTGRLPQSHTAGTRQETDPHKAVPEGTTAPASSAGRLRVVLGMPGGPPVI